MLRIEMAGLAVACILLAVVLNRDSVRHGRAFPSADAAARALVSAARADDEKVLAEILGPSAESFLSPGSVGDRRIRRDFANQASRKMRLAACRGRTSAVTLLTGEHEWPLPIPIVRSGDAWYFDTGRSTGWEKLKASH